MNINAQKNPKAASLMNVATGLFLISMVADKYFAGTSTLMTYIGIIFGFILISFGIYNFFQFKQPVVHDKSFGIASLVIGLLFLLAALSNWYFIKLPIYSLILGIISSIIMLTIGLVLIRKQDSEVSQQ